ncbi:histidine kinase [Streptomyces sp. NPDC029004]|uniref:sensor histidine kinase n=1 Tax=Streptomyces sp. NPDC029004 TaxID=3154490 RepID=UPI0033F0B3BE
MKASTPWVRHACLAMPVLLGSVDALLVHGRDIGLGMGAGLVAAVVLVARRRFPVCVFLATLPGMYLGYVWFAPLIALYTVAATRRQHWLLGVAGGLFAAARFLPYPLSDLADAPPREIALAAIDTCGAVAVPLALGLLARTRRELIANLAVLHRSRASERGLLADQVLATERARLAREMHDVVAHQVGLISLQAGALQVTTDDPEAQEGARTIRELSVRTLDELRHMVGVLRAAGGGAIDQAPGPRLTEVSRMIGESGLDVSYRNDIPEDARIPEGVERAAYRTVQEALTNAHRYAPTAHIHVLLALEGALEGDGDALRVEVRNGPSSPGGVPRCRTGGGHGLVGLKERAHSVGGMLEAHPTSDRGFLVSALLPLG